MSLAEKSCIPCQGSMSPFGQEEGKVLLNQLKEGWEIQDSGHLYKDFKFPNFIKAMDFANEIAIIAEKEGHHPNLKIAWGACSVEIWTHKINGLSENDFYLAAKIDQL